MNIEINMKFFQLHDNVPVEIDQRWKFEHDHDY